MAKTPSQTPPRRRSASEVETETTEYWCYRCNKCFSIETVVNLPDIVRHECKNGFVDLTLGSPFPQVPRLTAQALREEDAPPTLPQNPMTDY
ncbi:hypothetical protein ACFX12_012706 [Malus domestica]